MFIVNNTKGNYNLNVNNKEGYLCIMEQERMKLSLVQKNQKE